MESGEWLRKKDFKTVECLVIGNHQPFCDTYMIDYYMFVHFSNNLPTKKIYICGWPSIGDSASDYILPVHNCGMFTEARICNREWNK